MRKAFIALAGILAIPATIAFNHVMNMKAHGESVTEEMQGNTKTHIQNQSPADPAVSKGLPPYEKPEVMTPP